MTEPVTGRDALFRNPMMEVARFMNERHGNRYLMVDTTRGKTWSTKPFFDRYIHFPIDQDGVPQLEHLVQLCDVLDRYVSQHPENLLAVCSKHGQGRTSLVILALLMFRSDNQTLPSATSFFEHQRVSPEHQDMSSQSIDNMSQRRFLEYFAHYIAIKDRVILEKRPARLKRVQLTTVHMPETFEIYVHTHPGGTGKGFRTADPALGKSKTTTCEEVLEEAGNEEDNFERALEGDSGSLLKSVNNMMEESTIDSFRSGGSALSGKPVASSNESTGANDKVTVQKPPVMREENTQVTWEFKDLELSDEIRFEIHRTVNKVPEVAETVSLKTRLIRAFCCCFVGKDQRQVARFDGGMIFSCWLHMGWLEHNEHTNTHAKPSNRISLVFDRSSLDKASLAPPMRKQSSAMRMMFEFEVDRRIELRSLSETKATWGLVSTGVTSSEPETLMWLTYVGKRIWPSFASGFQKLITDGLEGARPNLPGPLKKIALSQCSFGDAYPEFGPINASSRNQEGLEVQLDMGLRYETETSIVLDTGFASFGISGLKIQGLLSLKFKPILAELPVLCAMQLLFVNPPTIELRFTNALEIANSTFVQSVIHSVVSKALSDILVLPNVMNINWGDPNCDSAGAICFQNLLPANVARVSIVAAKSLPMQNAIFDQRLPDSYVKMCIGSASAQTRVVAQSNDPIWEEQFDFIVYDERQYVQIEIFDVDFASRSQSIGKVNNISVMEICETKDDGKWLQLTSGSGDITGEILIKVMLHDLYVNPTKLQSYVVEVQSLPDSRMESESVGQEALVDHEIVGSDDGDTAASYSCVATIIDNHAGAVAVLVVTVFGGICPPSLGSPSSLQMSASVGKAAAKQQCVNAKELNPGTLSEKAVKAVEKFAALGLTSDQIATALGEEANDVDRMVRKREWNIEVPQKINVLCHRSDLAGANQVLLNLQLKGRTVAQGKVPMSKLVSHSYGNKYTDMVELQCSHGGGTVSLDMEIRFLALSSEIQDPSHA